MSGEVMPLLRSRIMLDVWLGAVLLGLELAWLAGLALAVAWIL